MQSTGKSTCLLCLCLLLGITSACSRDESASESEALPAGQLSGSVQDAAGNSLQGVMVTAYDPVGHQGITVFTDADGVYDFPALEPLAYRLQAKRVGYSSPAARAVNLTLSGTQVALTLQATDDFNHQLPASYYNARLVQQWPDAVMRDNFTIACANCHQIGNRQWQRHKTKEDWEAVLRRMEALGGPLLMEGTRSRLVPALLNVFGRDAPEPDFTRPEPPSGDTLRAVIREYELAPGQAGNCHDPEIGPKGVIYSEDGHWIDPATLERGHVAVEKGNPHSLKQGPEGRIWITVTGADVLARLDPGTGEVKYYEHPVIDGEKGVYPHTLKFDRDGRIWYTLTVSNHVARFDPATEKFVYHKLPAGQAREEDPPLANNIPIAYGLDIAPDGGIWWSQLAAGRIGRIDPETGALQAWATPASGPRRLGAGPDGRIWVPFYGPSRLGVFDPRTEEWTLYKYPGPADSELPYALNVHPETGHVWITGSNSDSVLRFDPKREKFTVYPLPTPNSFTRDIVFDDDGNVWTCTAGRLVSPEQEQDPGPGRIVKIELDKSRQANSSTGIPNSMRSEL